MYNNLKTNFKIYKYILRKIVREAKKVYYNRVLLQYKDNIFLTWSVIKQILNKNTQHNDLPAMFVHNDMIVDTANNIANSLNEYFINIGSQLAESLTTNVYFDHYLQNTYNHVAIKLHMIDKGEILSIIIKLKHKFSSGPDSISNGLLKHALHMLYHFRTFNPFRLHFFSYSEFHIVSI